MKGKTDLEKGREGKTQKKLAISRERKRVFRAEETLKMSRGQRETKTRVSRRREKAN